MELIIGKTLYKTNEYLFTGKNSSELIALSNISYLQSHYKNQDLPNLDAFDSENQETYSLKKEFEKEIKRPSLLSLNLDQKQILFIRDDLFYKINQNIQKDPVLSYESYVEIEKTLLKNNISMVEALKNKNTSKLNHP